MINNRIEDRSVSDLRFGYDLLCLYVLHVCINLVIIKNVLNANKSNGCIKDYAPQYLAKREAKSNKIPLDKKRWTKSMIQSGSDFD